MSFHVDGVCKTYSNEKTKALEDVTFSVDRGRVLALIGQNGAGKTTLIKCILNLIQHDSGTITFDGEQVRTLVDQGLVGYMPEYLLLPETVKIKEFVSDLITLRGLNQGKYMHRLDAYIKTLYMENNANKLMGHYSKGMAKKANFLQAVIHEPSLLILDEPTDGLDPVSRKAVLDEIHTLKECGSTVIITTHLLSDVSLVADDIIILQSGKVLQKAMKVEIDIPLDEWYIQNTIKWKGMEL